MNSRQSFIAAIAVAPNDDSLRLRFAEWLVENGDPERAEFIRAQIGYGSPGISVQDQAAMSFAADDLFEAYGERWCSDLLSPLGFDVAQYHLIPARSWMRVYPDGTKKRSFGGPSIELRFQRRDNCSGPFGRVTFERGLVTRLHILDCSLLTEKSIAETMRREPIMELSVEFDSESIIDDWSPLSDPSLRQIRDLNTRFCPPSPLPALPKIWNDLHLSGVRKLDLYGYGDAIPPSILAEFAQSSLAGQIDELILYAIDELGIQELFGKSEFHWKKLELSGSMDATIPALFSNCGLTSTLSELALRGWNRKEREYLGDEGVLALAALPITNLTKLSLTDNRITRHGLFGLANAPFTSNLECLDLSGNPLLDGDCNWEGLRALAAELNPNCLKLLRLGGMGLSAVPDFLESQFGKGVQLE
jgi:uncharacterized protein (TIGR02996 family)